MNLYVSNLAYALTDDELAEAFGQFGTVSSARVVLDRETGRSRGFGFVEMPDDTEARAAIDGMNNASLGGRPLKVVEARPREERPPRPPREGGGGGGGRPWQAQGRPERRSGGGGGGYGGGGGGGRDWDDDRGGGRRDGGKPRRSFDDGGGRRRGGRDFGDDEF